jgi:hypothetical protein
VVLRFPYIFFKKTKVKVETDQWYQRQSDIKLHILGDSLAETKLQ